MIDEESDTIVLTYHENHNVVTCVCGVVVQGEHLCEIKASTKIQIKECNYQSSYSGNKECCLICLKMEKNRNMKINGMKMRMDIPIATFVVLSVMVSYLSTAVVMHTLIWMVKRSVNPVMNYGKNLTWTKNARFVKANGEKNRCYESCSELYMERDS